MSTKEAKATSQTSHHEEVEETSAALVLQPQVLRFVQLWMTGQYSQAKIAQLLDVHPNTVKAWMKKEEVQKAIAEIQAQSNQMVATRLSTLAMPALEAMAELLKSPIDGVKHQAARDLLDRTGFKAKQEIKVDKTITTVEQKMKSLIDSTIVDAEWSEVVDD